MDPTDYLDLADWRRRVAELYAGWRSDSESDPERGARGSRGPPAPRDRLFREHPQSPLPAGEREAYAGVPYYDYDPAYRLTARVEPVDDTQKAATATGAAAGAATPVALGTPIALPTSGDEPFSFRRIGRVVLEGPFEGASLSLFWIEGYAGGLFLPFRDATSGTETYGAGRYLLDTIKGADLGGDPAANEITLDFNMAYHPSCVYDPRWNCPLAPPENRLAASIRVGERLPGAEAFL